MITFPLIGLVSSLVGMGLGIWKKDWPLFWAWLSSAGWAGVAVLNRMF